MNLKIAYSTLAGLMAFAQAKENGAVNLHPRQLEERQNTCDITAEIWCILQDGSNCATMNVRMDQCKTEEVTMYYKYCNLDDAQIVFDQPETYAELYEGGKISIGQDVPLQPEECRTIDQIGYVDTCTRGYINADMELEGWKGYENNYGSFCWKYTHYFPKINKYTLAPLPSPVFSSWKLLPDSLICTIRGSTETCQDHLKRKAQECEAGNNIFVNMNYDFDIQNTSTGGNACHLITSVYTKINNQPRGSDIASNWNFCPQQIKSLTDRRNNVEICSLQEQEVPFKVFVNGQTKPSPNGMTTIAFPKGNTVEPADYGIISLKCEVKIVDNDGIVSDVSCADYIARKNVQSSLPCTKDITFKSRIKNDSSTNICIDISTVEIDIEGPIGASMLNINNWSSDKKNFCKTDTPLLLKKTFNNIDLCDYYPGRTIDYKVTLNNDSPDLTRGDQISFPQLNDVGGTPSPNPPDGKVSVAPSPVPAPLMKCHQKPESISFSFHQRTCSDSSNSQIIRTRKLKRRLGHGKSGKGSNKNNHNEKCRACDDKCSFEQLQTNPIIYFYEKTGNTRQELHSEAYNGNENIQFSPTVMPDCLEIEIRDTKNRYQTVSFDVTCSSNADLYVGDTFGAMTIEGLDDCTR